MRDARLGSIRPLGASYCEGCEAGKYSTTGGFIL